LTPKTRRNALRKYEEKQVNFLNLRVFRGSKSFSQPRKVPKSLIFFFSTTTTTTTTCPIVAQCRSFPPGKKLSAAAV
jgi:hypothetical protein